MNSKNRLFAIATLVLAMTLGACSAAPDMDEVIVDTEINAPAPSNGDDGDGNPDLDDPSGGSITPESGSN